jgi:ankyrin repeat protein
VRCFNLQPLLLIFAKHGYTALHCAAEKGHRAAASQLLDKGADIEAQTGVRNGDKAENQ